MVQVTLRSPFVQVDHNTLKLRVFFIKCKFPSVIILCSIWNCVEDKLEAAIFGVECREWGDQGCLRRAINAARVSVRIIRDEVKHVKVKVSVQEMRNTEMCKLCSLRKKCITSSSEFCSESFIVSTVLLSSSILSFSGTLTSRLTYQLNTGFFLISANLWGPHESLPQPAGRTSDCHTYVTEHFGSF